MLVYGYPKLILSVTIKLGTPVLDGCLWRDHQKNITWIFYRSLEGCIKVNNTFADAKVSCSSKKTGNKFILNSSLLLNHSIRSNIEICVECLYADAVYLNECFSIKVKGECCHTLYFEYSYSFKVSCSIFCTISLAGTLFFCH